MEIFKAKICVFIDWMEQNRLQIQNLREKFFQKLIRQLLKSWFEELFWQVEMKISKDRKILYVNSSEIWICH